MIIRLIDPPLHEFMPSEEALFEEVVTMRVKGESAGLAEKEKLLETIRSLHESNPMMGHRGVRLSIAMPEIGEMQVRAIFEAAADCSRAGVDVRVEDDGALTVLVDAPDATARVWRWARDSAVGIRSLQPARNSLEQIFVDAVRENSRADS